MNGPEYLKSVPTILVMSSFDGRDRLGPSLIASIIEYLSLSYRTQTESFYLLNNFRLLFIPNPNVEGAFNNRKEEKTETGELVDPASDFNFGVNSPKSKCFQTSTARIMAHLFKEYLVIGALVVSQGKSQIQFPFGSTIKHEKQKSNDHKAFIFIAEKLAKMSPNDLSLNIRSFKTDLLASTGKTEGGFEDWAYASSEDIQNVDITCFDAKSYLTIQKKNSNLQTESEGGLDGNQDLLMLESSQNEEQMKQKMQKEKNLLKQFLVLTSTAVELPGGKSPPVRDLMKMSLKLLVPDQFSHRSFVYRVGMGDANEISLFPSEKEQKAQKKPFLRKRFLNTRLFGLLSNFSNFILKKMEIQDMHLSKNKKDLVLKVKVKGCLAINDFQLAADGLTLSFSKKDIERSGENYVAKLTLKPIGSEDISDFKGDIRISVLCDYTINDDNKPYSNLVRSKVDPNYKVIQSESVWSSTRVSQLHVHDLDVGLLARHKEKSDKIEDLFFRQRNDQVSLVLPQKFFAYIKDGFYLLFEYDLQERKVIYSIKNLDENISAKNIRFEDFSWEVKYFYENFDYSAVEHERDFSLNQEFFTGSPRSLEGFFSLLGKSLHVISVNQDNFYSTKSLIRVFEKDPGYGPLSGLPIPPEGLNCFSNDFSDSSEVFYLSILQSADLADVHEVHVFTLSPQLSRVRIRFFDSEVQLFEDQTFNGYGQQSLAQFRKFVGIVPDNFLNLLGQKIAIKYGRDEVYQECHLGRRNPFYQTKDILLLWGQKHNFYQSISSQSEGSFNAWVLLLVIVFAVLCAGLVLLIKYFKKVKEKMLDSNSPTKVEAI